jgi:hypothetical protein
VIDYYPIASLAVLIGAVAVVAHREDRTTARRARRHRGGR